MVVFPNFAAAALNGLLHESQFQFGGFIDLVTDANECAVLIKIISINIGAEIEQYLVGQRQIRFFRGRQWDGGS